MNPPSHACHNQDTCASVPLLLLLFLKQTVQVQAYKYTVLPRYSREVQTWFVLYPSHFPYSSSSSSLSSSLSYPPSPLPLLSTSFPPSLFLLLIFSSSFTLLFLLLISFLILILSNAQFCFFATIFNTSLTLSQCATTNSDLCRKTAPVTTGADATVYVRLLSSSGPENRLTPLHQHHPWQALFLCGDSDYFWDSVPIFGTVYPFLGQCVHFWDSVSVFGTGYPFLGQCIHFWDNVSIFGTVFPFLGQCIHFWGIVSIFGTIYPFLGQCIRYWGSVSIFGTMYPFLGQCVHFWDSVVIPGDSFFIVLCALTVTNFRCIFIFNFLWLICFNMPPSGHLIMIIHLQDQHPQ